MPTGENGKSTAASGKRMARRQLSSSASLQAGMAMSICMHVIACSPQPAASSQQQAVQLCSQPASPPASAVPACFPARRQAALLPPIVIQHLRRQPVIAQQRVPPIRPAKNRLQARGQSVGVTAGAPPSTAWLARCMPASECVFSESPPAFHHPSYIPHSPPSPHVSWSGRRLLLCLGDARTKWELCDVVQCGRHVCWSTLVVQGGGMWGVGNVI